MDTFKLSTATSVLLNHCLPEAIEKVIEAGFDGIDLWCGRPHLFRKDYSAAQLKQARRRLETAGLPVVSAMPAFFRYPFSLSSPLATIRRDSISYMKDCVTNAARMGAAHVLVVPTHSLSGQSAEDARRRFMDSLSQVTAFAESQGMRLGIEIVYPQLSDFMHSTNDAMAMIGEIGSDALGVVLDSGHIHLAGEDLPSALDRLGDRLWQVHVNDNDGKQQQNAIPGQGNFDFVRLLRLLNERHYTGFLSLELGWPYSFDPLPALSQSIERVRAFSRQAEA